MRGRTESWLLCASAPADQTINPLMKYCGEMKIFLEYAPPFCELSSERAEGWDEVIIGLWCCALMDERSPIGVSGVQDPLWTSVPSTGQRGWDWCLRTSTQHSCFLICLHQYFLLITLVLVFLLISKGRRLAHCERNFSTFSRNLFLVLGMFQNL